jgi:hypothetical protein
MSIRDPEVFEALRDEPELLAIADAVEETQRLPRSSRRRALYRSAALVAVGASALVAVLLWPSGRGRSPILDRALAAIGNEPVLHLVVRAPTGRQLVNLRTGHTTVPTIALESWSDRSLKRFHLLYRENGQVVAEFLYPQDRVSGVHVGTIDPAYAAIWSGYRQALASGKATIVGKGSLYGKPVYWLRFSSPRSEVAVDRRTYKLVAFRFTTDSGRHFDTRVLLARTEPFSTSAFKRRSSRPNPLTNPTSHSSGMHVAPVGPSRPGTPWLRAGATIAGLRLATVHRTQTTTGRKTINGFELVYGSPSGLRRSLTIDEARRPDDPSEWRGIPKGFMRLSVGEGADNNSPAYTIWTGYLIRHGVYVSIATGVSRAAALQAARALRPA